MNGDCTALALTLRPLAGLLSDPRITELCINRPGEVFVEATEGWRREALPFANFDWCLRLGKLAANSTCQRVDEQSPLLSASLPGGERIQVVVPPATAPGCVAICIRRPAAQVRSIEDLARSGVFKDTIRTTPDPQPQVARLQGLLEQRRFAEFMRLAVLTRQNIVVSGPTGSGKTTWTKALIREIPGEERLVAIEDAAELVFDRHPNHVRLFYSKDGQGRSRVTPKQLLESCLRLKPDRILLAELRSDEAFDYLRNVNSGHPGSITSVHASSASKAFEQLVLLVKQSAAGQSLSGNDIRALLRASIDVVVQFGVDGTRRFIREIWYEPQRRASTEDLRGLDA